MEAVDITINPGSEPLYQTIVEVFKERIASGVWKSGDRLPSEGQLCELLSVSRGTLRKAVGMLVDEGVLERTQGRGTFVASDKVSYPLAQELVSFAEELRRRGQEFSTRVLKSKVITIPSWLTHRLSVSEGTRVLALERVRIIEGKPSVLLKNWVLIDKCPRLELEDFTKVGLFEAIERTSGKQIKYGVRNFSARILEDEEAVLLGCETGDPIMFITQTTYGQDDEPIEFSNILLRTDRYQVESILYRK